MLPDQRVYTQRVANYEGLDLSDLVTKPTPEFDAFLKLMKNFTRQTKKANAAIALSELQRLDKQLSEPW